MKAKSLVIVVGILVSIVSLAVAQHGNTPHLNRVSKKEWHRFVPDKVLNSNRPISGKQIKTTGSENTDSDAVLRIRNFENTYHVVRIDSIQRYASLIRLKRTTFQGSKSYDK